MRRLRTFLAVVAAFALVLAPTGVQAEECASLQGHASLDWSVGLAKARIAVDGERQLVHMVQTGFVPTGEDTADIFYRAFFDQGTLELVEHSAPVHIGGPLFAFNSEVEVLAGGSGSMYWAGVSNVATTTARWDITGHVCFG